MDVTIAGTVEVVELSAAELLEIWIVEVVATGCVVT